MSLRLPYPSTSKVFLLITGECLATMDKAPKPGNEPNLVTSPVTVDNGQVYIDLAGGA